jgi:hypothetical protein
MLNIEYEVIEDKNYPGHWHVDAIDFANEGICFVSVFSGPNAQARAEEYAKFKNAGAQ